MKRLIVFKGKPGVGKSTLASALAKDLDYIYIDKDLINNLIFAVFGANRKSSNLVYELIYFFVEILLKRNQGVIVDCSLSHKINYDSFRELTKKLNVSLVVVEVKLNDQAELVKRMKLRKDLPEHRIKQPEDIKKQALKYEIYKTPEGILVDSSKEIKENISLIKSYLVKAKQ